jgi:hypothetical protein
VRNNDAILDIHSQSAEKHIGDARVAVEEGVVAE